jgi:hypothetical protein
MRHPLFLAPFALAIAIGPNAAMAQNHAPVVVELFTSEGCSSCPPADQVLATLDRNGIPGVEVIALGEHVDYWDHLGWKDKFSSPLFSARQQDYGRALHLQNIYTPQMVVGGSAEVLGSDWQAVQQAIRKAADGPHATASMSPSRAGVAIQVGHLPNGVKTAEMYLAVTEAGVETPVAAGENAGRRLRHVAVVRSLMSLGTLNAGQKGGYVAEARYNLKPEWNSQNLKLVLFVQDKTTLHIVGATSLKVPSGAY